MAALFGLALAAGCSSRTQYKVLSFFFDGVPAPGATTNRAAIQLVEEDRGGAIAPAVGTNRPAAPAAMRLVMHPPYEDKQCLECHESRFSVRMKGPQKQVCFACHDDFLEKAAFKHQPAEDGDCLACHRPHQSEFKGLLKQSDPQVCHECHEPADLAKVKAHTAAAGSGCVKCHDPHAGKDKYFLKPDAGQPGAAQSR